MTTEGAKALQVFEDAVRQQVEYTLHTADKDAIGKAAEIIQASIRQGGRLHVTGIGKPGHIAGYIASLITSTGTPAYFLHGTEAVHGSSGQLVAGDVVIAISNSGNTDEMMATVFCAASREMRRADLPGHPMWFF